MTPERHSINWKAFREGFLDGFSAGPLRRAFGTVLRRWIAFCNSGGLWP